MVKRAICVGCNYPGRVIKLNGAVADAFWVGKTLKDHYNFDDILVLHDVEPNFQAAPSSRQIRNNNVNTLSTRINIFEGLQWLIKGAQTGDVLVFHFSGFGIEVDDQDGWEDEGYSEALLPTDYEDGANEDEISVVLMEEVRDILTSAPPGCQVICIMDCDHSNTVCDPMGVASRDGTIQDPSENQGTNTAISIMGLKSSSILCGMLPTQNSNVKMEHSQHNRNIWSTKQAKELLVKARWQPQVGISSPKVGPYPHRASMPRSFPTCICYSASHLHQTSLELRFDDIGRVHGVLTYSFIQALQKSGFKQGLTHAKLSEDITLEMSKIRRNILSDMDQTHLLTITKPFADTSCMCIFEPVTPEMVPISIRNTPAFGRLRWPTNSQNSKLTGVTGPTDKSTNLSATIASIINIHDFSDAKFDLKSIALKNQLASESLDSGKASKLQNNSGQSLFGAFWSTVVGLAPEAQPNNSVAIGNTTQTVASDTNEPPNIHYTKDIDPTLALGNVASEQQTVTLSPQSAAKQKKQPQSIFFYNASEEKVEAGESTGKIPDSSESESGQYVVTNNFVKVKYSSETYKSDTNHSSDTVSDSQPQTQPQTATNMITSGQFTPHIQPPMKPGFSNFESDSTNVNMIPVSGPLTFPTPVTVSPMKAPSSNFSPMLNVGNRGTMPMLNPSPIMPITSQPNQSKITINTASSNAMTRNPSGSGISSRLKLPQFNMKFGGRFTPN